MKTLLALCLAVTPVAAFAGGENKPGAHFIENWDLNGDGQVTAAELAEKRGDVFFTFDSDEDGKLNAEEYGYFDEARKNDMEGQPEHAGGKMNKVQAGMQMAFNDVDGDGLVTREEFLGQVGAWLTSIDRNADGVITGEDFGPKA